LITRAPQSARCRLASGAAIAYSIDTTVTPANGNFLFTPISTVRDWREI
jgi:hypothetical protein